MKKSLIGAIVGGIIIFIWQFLSFGMINFHKSAQDYTEKQDAIMSFLNSQGLKDGGYVLPNYPENFSRTEIENAMKSAEGKPWAIVQYHSKMENDMMMNMIRGFLVNVVIVFLFIWLLQKMNMASAGTIITAALAVGLITFFNQPYTGHIWYKSFDIWAYFMDAIVSWGLTGLWLSWWMRRGTTNRSKYSVAESQQQVA